MKNYEVVKEVVNGLCNGYFTIETDENGRHYISLNSNNSSQKAVEDVGESSDYYNEYDCLPEEFYDERHYQEVILNNDPYACYLYDLLGADIYEVVKREPGRYYLNDYKLKFGDCEGDYIDDMEYCYLSRRLDPNEFEIVESRYGGADVIFKKYPSEKVEYLFGEMEDSERFDYMELLNKLGSNDCRITACRYGIFRVQFTGMNYITQEAEYRELLTNLGDSKYIITPCDHGGFYVSLNPYYIQEMDYQTDGESNQSFVGGNHLYLDLSKALAPYPNYKIVPSRDGCGYQVYDEGE